ncbi:hypothetical protein MYX78_02495 [Acidobacteria bacterium AH-259-G07]|nr:hypothetical protein [Acidobacteria bacterium AH-259-G07]
MMSPARGFSLITAIMLVLLMTSLALFLHLRITTQWKMATNVESQLYSLVLAENGIEYARTLLPHVELNSLLEGLDGEHSGTHNPEWRSPMPFREARRIDPSAWIPSSDDGLPAYNTQSLLAKGYRAEGNGYFFLRFSNNPEETAECDEDHIVLVRSLGIVPNQLRDPFFPEVRNNVALIEARFRQERVFSVPSPLTLFGDSGFFDWQDEQFSVEGGEEFGVSLVSVSQSTLYQNLVDSLSIAQQERIRGQGAAPSIRDASPAYISERIYQSLFKPDFWNHFLAQLPKFVDGLTGGIAFLPDGGVLQTSFSGILVARGDLILQDRAEVEGLLLHLGAGSLVLKDEAEIAGGVWMSNLDSTGEVLKSRPLSLRVSGSPAIRYDRAAIRKALTYFPPTQLGWRILFPETVQ